MSKFRITYLNEEYFNNVVDTLIVLEISICYRDCFGFKRKDYLELITINATELESRVEFPHIEENIIDYMKNKFLVNRELTRNSRIFQKKLFKQNKSR